MNMRKMRKVFNSFQNLSTNAPMHNFNALVLIWGLESQNHENGRKMFKFISTILHGNNSIPALA